MKKLTVFLLAVLSAAALAAGCAGPDVVTTEAETTVPETAAESTSGPETETETDAVTEPQPQIKLPDYYIDFRDEQNIYACSNLYNVSTEYTGDGMKVNFIGAGKESDPTYCFDPYMTLPLPKGDFSIDEYPFFVMMLYTSRDDMKGDIRFKTTGLKDPNSYPTYRFSYGGRGERKIVLDLQNKSVLFIAAGDSPVTGKYTDLRMDMFENNANTTDTFVIYCYAFFRTLSDAAEFNGLPEPESKAEELQDLSAYYKGDGFSVPDTAYKPKKLLYGFESGNYDFTVRKLKNNGWGGIVTNVKFNQKYLKDDAEFSLLSDVFKYAKTLGSHLWIYDEYQWPSGKAFGQVLEGHDEFEATGIELKKLTGSGDIKFTLPDNYISIAGADLIKGGRAQRLDVKERSIDVKNDGAYTVYVYCRRVTNQKKEDPADFSTLRDVDLLNPAAVDRFIETTYQKYKDKLGETFGLVEAFFTDEPQLGNRDMKDYVVWTDALPEKFKEMHGYDITENLYSLYDGDTDHDRLVRVDFYQTVSQLFREAYFDNIRDWCEENGVSSSGHLLFEENIQRQIETYGGDFMQLVGAMSIPGADILQVEPDRLLSKGTDIGNFMGLKYVSSAAKNAGKTKVHLEFTPSAVTGAPFFSAPGTYTIGGATLSSFFGANVYTVICGDSDVPASDLQKFTTYVGRINTLLDTAVTVSEIGVFYPVDAVRAAYTATGEHFDYNGGDEAAKINRLMQDTCYDILRSGMDFTVLDAQSIETGVIKNGKMTVGLGCYSVIVMPDVSVISCGALEKLEEFQSAGGTVIWLGCVPRQCDDVRESGRFAALISKLGCKVFKGDLTAALSGFCPRPMGAQINSGVFITEYKRGDDGKSVVYIANSSTKKRLVTVGGDGYGKYYIYDPYDGTVTEAEGKTEIAVGKYRAVLILK